jgi:hypothetical protein
MATKDKYELSLLGSINQNDLFYVNPNEHYYIVLRNHESQTVKVNLYINGAHKLIKSIPFVTLEIPPHQTTTFDVPIECHYSKIKHQEFEEDNKIVAVFHKDNRETTTLSIKITDIKPKIRK